MSQRFYCQVGYSGNEISYNLIGIISGLQLSKSESVLDCEMEVKHEASHSEVLWDCGRQVLLVRCRLSFDSPGAHTALLDYWPCPAAFPGPSPEALLSTSREIIVAKTGRLPQISIPASLHGSTPASGQFSFPAFPSNSNPFMVSTVSEWPVWMLFVSLILFITL